VPSVSRMAEPDMPVVRPAYNVVLVGESIFVHADVLANVGTAIDLGVASTMMTPTMMTSTMMTAATLASTLRIRSRHDSKSERRCDRKDE